MNFRYVLGFCLTGIAAAQSGPVNLPVADVLSRVTATENSFLTDLSKYKPLVETYIQFLKPVTGTNQEISDDAYFVGNVEFKEGVDYQGFNPDKTFGSDFFDFFRGSKKPKLTPRSFAQ